MSSAVPQKAPKSNSAPLTSVFYAELVITTVCLILALVGLLLHHVPVFLWLPSLLLLLSSCFTLSALIYLNKGVALRSQENLLFFILLTLVLIVFKTFCACILLLGLFVPHAVPWISCSLAFVAFVDVLFGLLSIAKTTVYRSSLDKRNSSKDTRNIKNISRRVEEIAVVNLGASRSTLVTNLEEGELVSFGVYN